MKFGKNSAPISPAEIPAIPASAPEPQPDKSAAKLKEAQAARREAERRAEELQAQLQTATLEITRLKVEVYDLTHGLA